jgi:hypothetical protein
VATLLHPLLGGVVFLVGLAASAAVVATYCPAPVVAVIEARGAMECLRRSAALTRGNRMRVFAVLAVAWSAGAIAIAVLQGGVVGVLIGPLPWWTVSGLFMLQFGGFNALLATAVGILYRALRIVVDGEDEDDLAAVFE